MASSESNENNSHSNSYIDKSTGRKHLNENEETIKSDQMASSKKLISNSDGKEQIEEMNEKELRSLLDEAMTYKNPRDVSDKSDTFKRLLQNVTEEDERKRKFESNSLHWKTQSNSLQNLFDDSHDHLPNQSQNSSKKNQNRRKNSTSVSTRRWEGGSLPVDMHHSSAVQSPSDQPFLSELKNNKKRKEKQIKDNVIDNIDCETDERKNFQRCFDSNKDTSPLSSLYHDAIEMKPFPNRIEMEVQDSSSSKFTTANNTPNSVTTMSSMMSSTSPIASNIPSKVPSTSLTNSVDSYITFPIEKSRPYQQAQTIDTIYAPSSTINPSNHIVLTGGNNYGAGSSGGGGKSTGVDQTFHLPVGMAVNSVIDSKQFPNPSIKYKAGQMREDSVHNTSMQTAILPTTHPSTVNSSKDSKTNKKRAAKSERNEKTIDVKSIEGFRGDDTVENLLNYIDGQHHNNDGKAQKNHPKNGIVSTNQTHEQLLNAEEKKKKMVAKNKEKMNKLKKSNSMDELYSTGRQEQQQQEKCAAAVAVSSSTANKLVQDVTLRSKSSNLTSGAKKADNKSQPKRNERRSWGTEGLWPESDILSRENHHQHHQPQDEQQETETSSSSSSSGVQLEYATSETINITNFETVNASSEADKFQVVIKKRKVKRKSNENTESKINSNTNNLQTYIIRRDGNSIRSGTKNYESRTTNMKNVKNSKPLSQDAKPTTAGKSRRKSTSSMPPSDGEDGEYSDGGDSVQSLPIETTKTTSSLLSAPQQPQPTSSSTNVSAEYSGKSSSKKIISNPVQTIPPSQQQTTHQLQQQHQKPTTFSYADIAKTNSTNRNNVITASTEKWPSISSSSSSSHQINDPFAISNFDAINTNLITTNNNINNIAVVNSSNSQKQQTTQQLPQQQQQQQQHQQHHHQQQKSTPLTPVMISTSTMLFPDLVESNNNKNKQLSNSPLEFTSSNGDATQTEKSLNGLERAFDNNNNNNINNTFNSNADDRLNNNNNNSNSSSNNTSNNQKITYSQSLLENHQPEIDANGNSARLEANIPVIMSASSKNLLIKSKSVDHNNLSSIEHYPALEKTKQTLSDVLSKPLENMSKVKQQKQMKPNEVRDESTNCKRTKKDKLALKKSTSITSTTHQFSTQNMNLNHRPAVIILNDCEKSSEVELGITFGFDINEHLLFGHHNGDAVADIDPSLENNIINNNSNCDIMNTNLSSNNNLTNQSCGIEMYENFIASPQSVNHSQQMIHPVAIIQSSSPKNTNENVVLDTSNQSSNDLGYLSSSLINNSTTSPANMKSSLTLSIEKEQSDNQIKEDYGHQNNCVNTSLELKQQHQKFEDLKMLVLPRYLSPEPAKNFNHEELATFVSEEWTKVLRTGNFFED